MRDKWWAKLLRIVGIVFMSLTALFTLMGGAGTTCVALNPTGYEGKFAGIAPFQWLYILFVILTVAIGVMGVRAVVLLIQGKKNAYRYSFIALVAGTAVGIIHIAASRILRGGSMPVDMVVYTTILTLIVFLLFRIPGVWQGVNFEKPEGEKETGKDATAIALGACGVLALIIQFLWRRASRRSQQHPTIRTRDVFHWALRDEVFDFQVAGVYVFPHNLERSCSEHPFFHYDDTVTRQNRENRLARILRILQRLRAGKSLFDASGLSICATGDRVVAV